jgi:hypothetical protein
VTEPRDLTDLVPADVRTELAAAVAALELHGPAVTKALSRLDRATTAAWNAVHPVGPTEEEWRLGLWPALGVGPRDRPVRTARSRVIAASSLAPFPFVAGRPLGPIRARPSIRSAAGKGMPGGNPTQRQGRP